MDDLPVRGHPAHRYRPAECHFESTRRMLTAESEELRGERRSCLDDSKSKDVLPGLSQSRKKPMRRRMESSRRQLLRLTHEFLESRQLLTIVTLSDRGNYLSTNVEYASGSAMSAADRVLDIDFLSTKSESVLMRVGPNVVVNSIVAYGPDGVELESWDLLTIPWRSVNPGVSWISV